MAFAYTAEEIKEYFGRKKAVWGTFTNGSGDTGGDIVTGLAHTDFISLQYTGAAVIADAPVANETFPLASGAVTIVTVDNADGIWFAFGD
jgi:hypothetical protein